MYLNHNAFGKLCGMLIKWPNGTFPEIPARQNKLSENKELVRINV